MSAFRRRLRGSGYRFWKPVDWSIFCLPISAISGSASLRAPKLTGWILR